MKLTLFGDEGASICRDCEDPCCRWVSAPMVTPEEAERIAHASKLTVAELTAERRAANGQKELYLRDGSSGACRFYDEETRKCGIYAIRPVDCRLFPLDLDRRRKRLHWIKYNVCSLAEKITVDDVRHAEADLLPAMGDTVDPYADAELRLYDRQDWTDLGPAHVPCQPTEVV